MLAHIIQKPMRLAVDCGFGTVCSNDVKLHVICKHLCYVCEGSGIVFRLLKINAGYFVSVFNQMYD